MNTDLVSKEFAEEIGEWVNKAGGSVVRIGEISPWLIEIRGIAVFTTIVIQDWIDGGANVFLRDGKVFISNWPEEEKVFEVRMKGNLNAETLYYNLKSVYIGDNLISVKEK